jgi:hypothetical protein
MSFRQFGGKERYERARDIKTRNIVSQSLYVTENAVMNDVSINDLDVGYVDSNKVVISTTYNDQSYSDNTNNLTSNTNLILDNTNTDTNTSSSKGVSSLKFINRNSLNQPINSAAYSLEQSADGQYNYFNYYLNTNQHQTQPLSESDIVLQMKYDISRNQAEVIYNTGIRLYDIGSTSSAPMPASTEEGLIGYDSNKKTIALWNGEIWEDIINISVNGSGLENSGWQIYPGNGDSENTIYYSFGHTVAGTKPTSLPSNTLSLPKVMIQPFLLRDEETYGSSNTNWSARVGGDYAGYTIIAGNNTNNTYAKTQNLLSFLNLDLFVKDQSEYNFDTQKTPATPSATSFMTVYNSSNLILYDVSDNISSADYVLNPLQDASSGDIQTKIENLQAYTSKSVPSTTGRIPDAISSAYINNLRVNKIRFYFDLSGISDNDLATIEIDTSSIGGDTTTTVNYYSFGTTDPNTVTSPSYTLDPSSVIKTQTSPPDPINEWDTTFAYASGSSPNLITQFAIDISLNGGHSHSIYNILKNTTISIGRTHETGNTSGYFKIKQIYAVYSVVDEKEYNMGVGTFLPNDAKLQVYSDNKTLNVLKVIHDVSFGNQVDASAALLVESTNGDYASVEIKENSPSSNITSLYIGSGTDYSWLSRYQNILDPTKPSAISIRGTSEADTQLNNVGIKVPDPKADLHIKDTFLVGTKYSDSGYMFNDYNTFGDAYGPVLVLGDYDDHTGIAFLQLPSGDIITKTTTVESKNGDLSIRVGDLSNNGTPSEPNYVGVNYKTSLYCDNKGNVGIGIEPYTGLTTVPDPILLTEKLEVSGNILVSGKLIGDVSGDVTGNLTGDVTGNLTGDVSGNVTGNSGTATKLHTARTITIGDISNSFDGTENITYTLAEIGVPSLDGSGATGTWDINISGGAYKLSLEKSIQIGNLTNTFDGTADIIYRLAEIGVPSLDGSGATGTWDINITGNSGSSTKLQTARTITIGNISNSFDGTQNITYTLEQIGAVSQTAYDASIGQIISDIDDINSNYLYGISVINGKIEDLSGEVDILRQEVEGGVQWQTEINTSNIYHNIGNVGIGTSSPGYEYKLNVNGTLNATTILQNGSPITSGGGFSNVVYVGAISGNNNTSYTFQLTNIYLQDKHNIPIYFSNTDVIAFVYYDITLSQSGPSPVEIIINIEYTESDNTTFYSYANIIKEYGFSCSGMLIVPKGKHIHFTEQSSSSRHFDIDLRIYKFE